MEVGVGMRFVSSGKEVAVGIDVGLSGVVGIVEVSFVLEILVDVQAADVRVNSTSKKGMMNVTAEETVTS